MGHQAGVGLKLVVEAMMPPNGGKQGLFSQKE
jgi:hypothetical protein